MQAIFVGRKEEGTPGRLCTVAPKRGHFRPQQSSSTPALRTLPEPRRDSDAVHEANDRNPAGWENAPDQVFADIVEQYHAALYRFAFSLTRSEADAWDLTQQTFYTWSIKSWQLRDGAKARSWLFTTLHRAFLQTQRRQHRFPHYELEEVEPELPRIAPSQESSVDSGGVLDALAEMDEVFRAPLALFYLEDCSYREIAELLKVPLGTVKSRIARGIAKLQELMEVAEVCEERMAA